MNPSIRTLLSGLAASAEWVYPGEFSGPEPDPRHAPLEDELAALGPASLEPLASAARALPAYGERLEALRALRRLRPTLDDAGRARVDEVHREALADPWPGVREEGLEALPGGPGEREVRFAEADLARLDALRGDRSSSVRAAVARRLAVAADPRALDWLEAMVPDDASGVRQAVYPLLAAKGKARLRALLLPRLAAADPAGRFDAMVALAGGPWLPAELPALVALAADPDPRLRRLAAAELSESGDPRALGPVLGLCADADGWVRAVQPLRVVALLRRLGTPPRADVDAALAAVAPLLVGPRHDLEVQAAEAVGELLRAHGPPAAGDARDRLVEALARALLQASQPAIAPAARAACELPDPRLVMPLARTLERGERGDGTDGAVTEALARIGAPAVAALLALFAPRPGGRERGRPPPDLRLRAARVLARMKEASAAPPLCGALRDRDAALREEVAVALGVLGSPSAVGPLIRALADLAPVAAAAARSLGQLGDARARPHLERAAAHADPRVRKLAAEALARLR